MQDNAAELREKLRKLANRRRREGVLINRKKTQRIYQKEGLAVRRRRIHKRAVWTKAPAPVLAISSQRWSLGALTSSGEHFARRDSIRAPLPRA